MVRLSDIIKGDKSPLEEEPEDKKSKKEQEKISFRELQELSKELRKKDEVVSPEKKKREEENVDKIYNDAYEFVEEIFEKAEKALSAIIDNGFRIISQMIESIRVSDALFLKTVYKKGVPENYISHSTNVCIYAIKLGLGLNYENHELQELGMSAFFHDIGIIKVPEKILSKLEKLTPEDERMIQRHSKYGHDIIMNGLGEKYQWVAEIVYQEHEREGGQGYPRGLKGEQIHEYAKIVGISDVYEALTHNRPYRKRILPYNAVREIIENYKDHFASQIIKVLLIELSVFPLHSYVKLNSNEIGMVIETSKVQPLKPVVKILYDSKGKKIRDEKILDLRKTPLLYITESIHEEDFAT
jgi:HD-GYP domain-containing protein (c-di-GMP phosphodiesterase class II)